MIKAICSFMIVSFIQGIILSMLIYYFNSLSEKRKNKEITNLEKWQQGIMSPIITLVLEAILAKDPIKNCAVITVWLIVSYGVILSCILLGILRLSYGPVMVSFIFLIIATWCSKS